MIQFDNYIVLFGGLVLFISGLLIMGSIEWLGQRIKTRSKAIKIKKSGLVPFRTNQTACPKDFAYKRFDK